TPPYDLMKKGYGTKRSIRAGFFPPLGVGYLAAILIKNGHNVKIIDCPPLNYGNEEVINSVKDYRPGIIGISSLTASAEESYSLVRELKKEFPAIPILYGGSHANSFPDHIIENIPMIDCLSYGEGERTILPIVDSFEKTGKIAADLPGTWGKTADGRFIKNPPTEPIIKMDELLPPAYELYDYKIYQPLPLQYKKMPNANLVTSRGCPWGKCTFCFNSGRAKQIYRRHSPARVVAEIKSLYENQGVREITFWDDNFLINERWIIEFCDLLDKSGIKIPWSACGRVNSVTENMLKRAKQSGLWCIFFGFETGNQDLLDRIKKGATLEQARRAVKWCDELGLDIRASFMLGLPGETPEKARNTINFAKELNTSFAMFLITYPEWGTELYDDAMKSGYIVPLYKGRTTPTYIPNGYKNAEEVREMQKKAFRAYYFRPAFFWKHLKRIKSWDIIKQYYYGLKLIIGMSE
ncbi:MAG: radical SAM protein, partial [Patescibacteria group bacterium]